LSGMRAQYTSVKPHLSAKERRRFVTFFRRVCGEVDKVQAHCIPDLIRRYRGELRAETAGLTSDDGMKGAFARSVVLDLVGAGWRIRVVRGVVQIGFPHEGSDNPIELKAAVRMSHRLERDDQLLEPSVREFVQTMERRQLTSKGWHSIYSLMRA